MKNAPSDARQILHEELTEIYGNSTSQVKAFRYDYYYGSEWRSMMAQSKFSPVPRGELPRSSGIIIGGGCVTLTRQMKLKLRICKDSVWANRIPADDTTLCHVPRVTTVVTMKGIK
jgi:hypothetical protein